MKNMRLKSFARHQRGAASLDQIIAVVIGLVVLAGVAAAGASAFSGSDAGTEIDHMQTLLSNIRGGFRGSDGYGTAGTDLAALCIQGECQPKDMVVTGTKLYNRWNGQITLVSTGLGFTMTTPSVPKSACSQLVAKISQSGLYTVSINGTAQTAGAVNAGTAQGLCTSASNTLAFTATM